MSKNNDDYISFDKALAELNLRDEQLKRMVSEGEIRAFREGSSMKFRREDVDTMSRRRKGEEDLVFADALEDDTGMVTEEISDEDTLLAEDDIESTRRPSAVRSRPVAKSVAAAPVEETQEPGWVTALAVAGGLVGIYGLLVAYSIAANTPPGGITGMFAN